MSLLTYIDNQIQAFRQKSSQGLLIGLQGGGTNILIGIHGAYATGNTEEPTKIELVKIENVGAYNGAKCLYNFKEIERIELPLLSIQYDSETNQYLVDNTVDLDFLIDECIYFIEFTNGVNIFKTEAFYINDGFNFPRGIDYDKIGINMKVY